MSERDRGLTVAQAIAIAEDPQSAPGVLGRVANGYPEAWQALLTNPNTPHELREWLHHALTPKPVESVVDHPLAAADETRIRSADALVVERKPKSSSRSTPSTSRGDKKAQQVARSRRHSRPRGGRALTVVVSLVAIAALGFLSFVTIRSAPAPGLIVTQELATEPSLYDTWTYDLLQGQANGDCIEWSFQSLAQDVVIVLSQHSSANEDCDEIDDKPQTFLASVNTVTGVQNWRINVEETLSWTDNWTADLTGFTGLNEIVVKFTDSSDSEDEDPLQTLVPFNRLDGSVTDAVVARSESDPVITAPHIQMGRLPWSDRDIFVGFPANDDERRLSLRRAKSLTEDKWNLTTELEPMHGNPIVDEWMILGSEYDDKPQAVNLLDGDTRSWKGPAGGKLIDFAGNYVHVAGDGTKERVSNNEAEGGKAETDDCDAECITLTGIDSDGDSVWEKSVPGYAVARNPEVVMNADRSQFALLFVTDGDRNSATRISPMTGEPIWSEENDWGDFEISKFADTAFFFTFQKTVDADHTDIMQMRSVQTGGAVAEFDIPNDSTRVDGISAHFAYLVDEPDRASAVEDLEAGESVSADTDEEDDSDPAAEERTCLTAINFASRKTAWTWNCNGYQHVVLAGGNWVIFDETPGEQTMKGLRVTP